MSQLFKLVYAPPCCRTLTVSVTDCILQDSSNRNRVVIDYDDNDVIELS